MVPVVPVRKAIMIVFALCGVLWLLIILCVLGFCGFLPEVLGLSLILDLPLDFCEFLLGVKQVFIVFLGCTGLVLGWVHILPLCYL